MPTLYIAGPALPLKGDHEDIPAVLLWRQFRGQKLRNSRVLNRLYDHIQSEARAIGWDTFAPFRTEDIDGLPAEDFVDALFRKLNESSALVTILVEGDQSVPAEAGFAAARGIPQVIISDKPDTIPRLLLGLPGVNHVIDAQTTKAEFERGQGGMEADSVSEVLIPWILQLPTR